MPRSSRDLQHRTVRCEIAVEHDDSTLRREWLGERTDHVRISTSNRRQILPETLPRYRQALTAQQAPQLLHDRRNAAGGVELTHQIAAGGFYVDEVGGGARKIIEA